MTDQTQRIAYSPGQQQPPALADSGKTTLARVTSVVSTFFDNADNQQLFVDGVSCLLSGGVLSQIPRHLLKAAPRLKFASVFFGGLVRIVVRCIMPSGTFQGYEIVEGMVSFMVGGLLPWGLCAAAGVPFPFSAALKIVLVQFISFFLARGLFFVISQGQGPQALQAAPSQVDLQAPQQLAPPPPLAEVIKREYGQYKQDSKQWEWLSLEDQIEKIRMFCFFGCEFFSFSGLDRLVLTPGFWKKVFPELPDDADCLQGDSLQGPPNLKLSLSNQRWRRALLLLCPIENIPWILAFATVMETGDLEAKREFCKSFFAKNMSQQLLNAVSCICEAQGWHPLLKEFVIPWFSSSGSKSFKNLPNEEAALSCMKRVCCWTQTPLPLALIREEESRERLERMVEACGKLCEECEEMKKDIQEIQRFLLSEVSALITITKSQNSENLRVQSASLVEGLDQRNQSFCLIKQQMETFIARIRSDYTNATQSIDEGGNWGERNYICYTVVDWLYREASHAEKRFMEELNGLQEALELVMQFVKPIGDFAIQKCKKKKPKENEATIRRFQIFIKAPWRMPEANAVTEIIKKEELRCQWCS